MPRPVYNKEEVNNNNRLIRDELHYNKRTLAEEHQQLVKNLTDEQKSVYEKIMRDVNEDKGGFFFLYGFGGTCKTFIWRTLSSAIRSRGDIVLIVASSGIASLLLPGGRTAHSRFVIPLNVTEDSTCNIKQDLSGFAITWINGTSYIAFVKKHRISFLQCRFERGDCHWRLNLTTSSNLELVLEMMFNVSFLRWSDVV
ncbi:uncharacterized protein [Nicotiana sylvestris]|uniref:uncharacterized protein n=1 Tax=Nicotiana sylvestris TaxID=4096 RepID=UPI00388C476C